MRVLIDECLDWRLGRALPGHECVSVSRKGWGGIKNGQLLALAAGEFDAFLTGDRNLAFQQNVPALPLAIVVLAAPSTRLVDTLPLMAEVLRVLSTAQPGTVTTASG